MPIFFFIMEDHRLKGNRLIFAQADDLNQKNDIDSPFDDSTDSDFPTNPMELMNVIRNIEAMNDRTPPTDAIDEALKAFERESYSDSSLDEDIR